MEEHRVRDQIWTYSIHVDTVNDLTKGARKVLQKKANQKVKTQDIKKLRTKTMVEKMRTEREEMTRSASQKGEERPKPKVLSNEKFIGKKIIICKSSKNLRKDKS